ncbi:hypothetical protein J5N97_018989 [Dioscorea zingiberensis]|uniref:Uncharacterized protein n=1 Tax=Dioscorea zingiberensis TaxID=325984 RepID=A0A9D5CDW4_9LILI|nr:hypothetical protein J5N97_018989 [Dioscorea zingiberensis]
MNIHRPFFIVGSRSLAEHLQVHSLNNFSTSPSPKTQAPFIRQALTLEIQHHLGALSPLNPSIQFVRRFASLADLKEDRRWKGFIESEAGDRARLRSWVKHTLSSVKESQSSYDPHRTERKSKP